MKDVNVKNIQEEDKGKINNFDYYKTFLELIATSRLLFVYA